MSYRDAFRPYLVFVIQFKGWVQYFSMQVVINKCFLINLKKNLT